MLEYSKQLSINMHGMNIKGNNCLIYEIEGNMKERKFTNKAEAQLEPQDSTGHDFLERADHDVTQTINDEAV